MVMGHYYILLIFNLNIGKEKQSNYNLNGHQTLGKRAWLSRVLF
jgi:hypothetical protein